MQPCQQCKLHTILKDGDQKANQHYIKVYTSLGRLSSCYGSSPNYARCFAGVCLKRRRRWQVEAGEEKKQVEKLDWDPPLPTHSLTLALPPSSTRMLPLTSPCPYHQLTDTSTASGSHWDRCQVSGYLCQTPRSMQWQPNFHTTTKGLLCQCVSSGSTMPQ